MKAKKLHQLFIDLDVPVNLHGTKDIKPWYRQLDEAHGPTHKQVVMDLASRNGYDYVCSRCKKPVAKHGIGKHPDVCKYADKPTSASSAAMRRSYVKAQAVLKKKEKRGREDTSETAGPKTKKSKNSTGQKAAGAEQTVTRPKSTRVKAGKAEAAGKRKPRRKGGG